MQTSSVLLDKSKVTGEAYKLLIKIYNTVSFQIWHQDRSEPQHAQRAAECDDLLDRWQLCVQHQGELGQRHEELREWDLDHGGWPHQGDAAPQQDESAISERPRAPSSDQTQSGENVFTGWPENKSEPSLPCDGYPLLQMAQLPGSVSKKVFFWRRTLQSKWAPPKAKITPHWKPKYMSLKC